MVDRGPEREAGLVRWGLGRTVALGALMGVALLVAIGAGWYWWETDGAWRSHPILEVEARADGSEYALWMGCFDGEMRASVSEEAERVILSVEIRGDRSENDCMRGVSVTLDEPLGDRVLIDGYDGDSAPTR